MGLESRTMAKDMMMLGKEKMGMVSGKEKKFGASKVSKKTFGFGKKQFQGMKGKPVNYGSV